MARTPKTVEDRREQILDAAMRAFARKGFTRATNKDIAQEAGITPGLIYHYFENKEAVLKAMIEERSPAQLVRALSQEARALPPATFLRQLTQQALQRVEGDDFVQMLRVMLPEAIHNETVSPLIANVLGDIVTSLSSYLAVCMERGEIRQADSLLVAQTFIGSVMAFVLRRHVLHDPLALQYSQQQIADIVVTTMLEGLLPR
jgi:AcrR family transcriptional regulator